MRIEVKSKPCKTVFGALALTFLLGSTVVQADPFAYVPNWGPLGPTPGAPNPDSVSVFDVATQLSVATIPVGDKAYDVGFRPDGTQAYVVNQGPETNVLKTVDVIDTDPLSATFNTVLATITVGRVPYGVVVNPTGTRAYVTNRRDDTVSVIDVDPLSATVNTVVFTIDVNAEMIAAGSACDGQPPYTGGMTFCGPKGLAVTPDGAELWVTNFFDDTIAVIDIAQGSPTIYTVTQVKDLSVGCGPGPQCTGPRGIVMSPNGALAYVTSRDAETVTVLETNGFSWYTIDLAPACGPQCVTPRGIALTPDGLKLYVANYHDDSVSVIDTTTGTVIAGPPSATALTVGMNPFGVAVTPDGSEVWVTNFNNGASSISVIDTATDTVVNTIVGGGLDSPSGLGLNCRFTVPPMKFTAERSC